MYKLVVILSFVACAFGAAIPEDELPQLDGRIVGGFPTNIGNYPYQISIQLYGSHHCGGAIYSNRVIVTAAHCLVGYSASSLRVRAGSTYAGSGGQLVGISRYVTHPGYNGNTMANDVAVIHLSSSLNYNSNVRNIGLASSTPGNGASAVVSGWGRLSSGGSAPNQLMAVNVNIVGSGQCASTQYGYGSLIKGGMICAAAPGKDACQGDSGGPLVSGGVLVGVVSWGYGCALQQYPGVYANVASYRSWIISNS